MQCSVSPVLSQHSPQLYDYTGVWQKHTVRDHRGAECVREEEMNMHECLCAFSVCFHARVPCRSVSLCVCMFRALIPPSDSDPPFFLTTTIMTFEIHSFNDVLPVFTVRL